jgi:MoxR-like ATPase
MAERNERTDDARLELLARGYAELRTGIAQVIVGQARVVEELLIALFAGGHSILVGVPGLAKTLLANTLAQLLSLTFRRVQFTPDLMPSDITGTDVLEEDPETGRRSFRFLRGPVFANMLLADEINRTPPKTQAALLEAMQERRVTVGERTLELPEPFFVVATQNPIEQEGTYRLPEAQLDRFLLAVRIEYPDETEELEILRRAGSKHPALSPVISREDILEIQSLVPRVPTAPHVFEYALELVRASRPTDPRSTDAIRQFLICGAGPRAAQCLILAAKARAAIHGNFHVAVDDVRAVAPSVLAHRLVLNFRAAAEGVSAESIVSRLLDDARSSKRS